MDDKQKTLIDRLRAVISLDTPQDSDLVDEGTDFAAGFVPGLGTAMGARDFERARREDDKMGMVLSAAGMLPVLGGFARLGKNADKTEKIIEMMRKKQKTIRTDGAFPPANIMDHGTVKDMSENPVFGRIPVEDIIPVQSTVNKAALDAAYKAGSPRLPIEVTQNAATGKYYVHDGNHRAIAAKLRGDKTIPAENSFLVKDWGE